MRQSVFLISFLFIITLFSCDSNRVFERNIPIHNHTWHQDSIVLFEMEIADTISLHNFYINIRNGGDYPWRNIFLFVKTKYPSGTTQRDTIECMLADSHGRWYGDGIGDLWFHQVMFVRSRRFPMAGKYEFHFQQAMRKETIPSVFDVGLRIETSR